MKHVLDNQRIVMAVSITAISLAIVFAVLSGIVGVGRSSQLQQWLHLLDAKYLYIAGENWLAGMNPYDSQIACQIFTDACDPHIYRFAYPPTAALFFVFLALFNWATAAVIFLVANVLALVIWVYFCLRLLANHMGEGSYLTDLRKSLFIAMAVGNIPVVSVFWLGQTAIMIAALMVMSFYFYRQGRDWASGLCLALALIKPHLSYPLFFWFLLEGRSRIILSALMVSLGLFLVPTTLIGLERTFAEWIQGVRTYLEHPSNLDPRFTISLTDEILRWFGLGAYAGGGAFMISLGLIFCLHRMGSQARAHILLGILMSIGLLFGQAHHYDLVMAAPVLLFFLARLPGNSIWQLFPILFFFALFNLPRHKLLLPYDLWILAHHREIILLGALIYLIVQWLRPEVAQGRQITARG